MYIANEYVLKTVTRYQKWTFFLNKNDSNSEAFKINKSESLKNAQNDKIETFAGSY
jgi:hypothetical protein